MKIILPGIRFLIVLIYIAASISCTSRNPYSEVVLHIGDLEVTEYEYDRKLKKFEEEFPNANATDLERWKQALIDQYVITAQAYAEHFDTSGSVHQAVEAMANYMMVQQGEYLWKYKYDSLIHVLTTVSSKDILKRSHQYRYCYLCGDTYDVFKGYHPDSVYSKSDFENLKRISKNDPQLIYDTLTMQWPFITFWEHRDMLYGLKVGEVSPLVNSNGYLYLFLLEKVETIPYTDEEKILLTTELKAGVNRQIAQQQKERIFQSAKPVFYSQNIQQVINYFEQEQSFTHVTDSLFLMKFYLGDSLIQLNKQSFDKYYQALPIQRVINSKEMLEEQLLEYCYQTCMVEEAKRYRLFESDTFRLAKKSYFNDVLYYHYLDNQLTRYIQVDSGEVVECYYENSKDYVRPTQFVAELFIFANQVDAYRNYGKVQRSVLGSDTAVLNDLHRNRMLQAVKDNIILDIRDDTIPLVIINQLLTIPCGNLLYSFLPMQSGCAIVLKKEEGGIQVQPLNEIYEQVKLRVLEKKLNHEVDQLSAKLRREYTVESTI